MSGFDDSFSDDEESSVLSDLEEEEELGLGAEETEGEEESVPTDEEALSANSDDDIVVVSDEEQAPAKAKAVFTVLLSTGSAVPAAIAAAQPRASPSRPTLGSQPVAPQPAARPLTVDSATNTLPTPSAIFPADVAAVAAAERAALRAGATAPSSYALHMQHGAEMAERLDELCRIASLSKLDHVRVTAPAPLPIYMPAKAAPVVEPALTGLSTAIDTLAGAIREAGSAAGSDRADASTHRGSSSSSPSSRTSAEAALQGLLVKLQEVVKVLEATAVPEPTMRAAATASPAGATYIRYLEAQLAAFTAEAAKERARADSAEASNVRLRNARRFETEAPATASRWPASAASKQQLSLQSARAGTQITDAAGSAVGTEATTAVKGHALLRLLEESRGRLTERDAEVRGLRERLDRAEAALAKERDSRAGGTGVRSLSDLSAFRDGKLLADAIEPLFGWRTTLNGNGGATLIRLTRANRDVQLRVRYVAGVVTVEGVEPPHQAVDPIAVPGLLARLMLPAEADTVAPLKRGRPDEERADAADTQPTRSQPPAEPEPEPLVQPTAAVVPAASSTGMVSPTAHSPVTVGDVMRSMGTQEPAVVLESVAEPEEPAEADVHSEGNGNNNGEEVDENDAHESAEADASDDTAEAVPEAGAGLTAEAARSVSPVEDGDLFGSSMVDV
jgi:hypothetical protein